MRVLVEVIHIFFGLVAAMLLASLGAWAYPLATRDIWLVSYVMMVAIVLMGVGPIRRAFAADRETLKRAVGRSTDG